MKGFPSTHTTRPQGTGFILHLCKPGRRQRQLNPTDPRAPRQVTGSVSRGLAQSQGRTLAHRASAVLSYCSVQCFEGIFKNVSGQYPLNRNCS